MGKKAKLIHVQAKKSRTAVSLSSSSAVSVTFLLEAQQLSSSVQAGATRRRPTTKREKKNHILGLWRRKANVRI